MTSRPRRINQMQADASRRRLEALFENPRNDSAHGKVGEVGKAESTDATLQQLCLQNQGGRK